MAKNMQPGPTRLGDLLVAAKLITPLQLEEALDKQRRSGGQLGEILLSLGFVTEFDMYSALADQLNYPFLSNPETQADPAAAKLVNESLARQHQVAPLRLDGEELLVATAAPLNFMALDDIGLQSGRRVRPVVSPPRAVQRALLKVYSGEELPQQTAAQPSLRAFDLAECSENAVVKLVNTLVAQALQLRATDIHIEPGETRIRVRYRVDGVMQESTALCRSALQPVLSRIKVMAGMDIAERRIPQDGRIEVEMHGHRLDLRVNSVPTIYGEKLAIRILDRGAAILGLSDLGLEPDLLNKLRALLAKPNGMILVTGPTGSGKTTTLMAALSELNDPSRQILTIEDPVEYQLPGVNQVQVNVKAGLTFASGLRAFLRQDPDVIMVGEVRDRETADIAVRAALTGHLVLSTLHTNSAAGAPGRLIDMGIEPFLTSSSLIGVLAQRLVRALCPRCRRPYQPAPDDPDYSLLAAAGMEGATLYRAGGCGHCGGKGLQGRIPLVELLPVTAEVRELITKQAHTSQIEQAVRAQGMRTLWQDGLIKASRGLTTLEEVKRVAFSEE